MEGFLQETCLLYKKQTGCSQGEWLALPKAKGLQLAQIYWKRMQV